MRQARGSGEQTGFSFSERQAWGVFINQTFRFPKQFLTLFLSGIKPARGWGGGVILESFTIALNALGIGTAVSWHWAHYRKHPHETTCGTSHRAGVEDNPWHSAVSSDSPS